MRRKFAALVVLAAVALSSSSRAADPGPAEKAANPPRIWAARPTRAQLVQAGPAGGARAVLQCHVEATGQLSACASVSETPSASGFAAKVAAMAPLYRLTPEAMASEVQDQSFTFSENTFPEDIPPDWLRKPTANDLMTVWPRAALRSGVGGSAVLTCIASTQGALFDCVVMRETPARMGFGSAALALTPQFLMRPAKFKGQPTLSVINIPIVFKSNGRISTPAFTPAVISAAMAWPEAPTYADVAAVYPKGAREAHLAGRATLLCGFDIFGHLDTCRTIAEEPKGQGFGNAAHLLTRHFRAAPKTADGRPIGQAELEVPFVFDPAVLGDTKPPVGKAQWMSLPSADETDAAFGAILKTAGGALRATLECTVQQGGGLSDCAVASEDPAGRGLGAAALTLTPRFKVATWTLEGLPTVGGRIRVPIRLEGSGGVSPKP